MRKWDIISSRIAAYNNIISICTKITLAEFLEIPINRPIYKIRIVRVERLFCSSASIVETPSELMNSEDSKEEKNKYQKENNTR